jgi:hypothetical protein
VGHGEPHLSVESPACAIAAERGDERKRQAAFRVAAEMWRSVALAASHHTFSKPLPQKDSGFEKRRHT